MAKVLVLSTHDSHLGGHGWSKAELLRKKGHQVCFICCFKTEQTTKNYFFDTKKIGIGKLMWRSLPYITCLFTGTRPNIHAFASTHLFGPSAENILAKCDFIPDYIYLAWTANFLTEKTIYRLYELTKAKLIFSFVDEAYLASCHYPADCDKWQSGCKNCEAIKINKWMASRAMKIKSELWSRIPGFVICTPYEKNLVKKSKFLGNKTVIGNLTNAIAPYSNSKYDARELLGIPQEDFVIFAGANSFKGKRKGMSLLSDSIHFIAEKIESGYLPQKRITLLLIGNGVEHIEFDKRVNQIKRSFLPKDIFFNAYYACDIHVSPSLADSGPMMINYSYACERPVVAFPIGSAFSLVVDGVTGFLAKYGDSESLAECILKMLELDMSALHNMGLRGKERMATFDSEPLGDIVK